MMSVFSYETIKSEKRRPLFFLDFMLQRLFPLTSINHLTQNLFKPPLGYIRFIGFNRFLVYNAGINRVKGTRRPTEFSRRFCIELKS